MTLLLIYLFVAIGFSFYCSVAEAVLLSITPSFIATLAKEKPKVADRLKGLKANIDRPLAAILSLNTIAHTIGAAGVGAEAAKVFQSTPLAVVSGVMTLLILVFSEIIPKTIGALYWRALGPFVAWSVGYFDAGSISAGLAERTTDEIAVRWRGASHTDAGRAGCDGRDRSATGSLGKGRVARLPIVNAFSANHRFRHHDTSRCRRGTSRNHDRR